MLETWADPRAVGDTSTPLMTLRLDFAGKIPGHPLPCSLPPSQTRDWDAPPGPVLSGPPSNRAAKLGAEAGTSWR